VYQAFDYVVIGAEGSPARRTGGTSSGGRVRVNTTRAPSKSSIKTWPWRTGREMVLAYRSCSNRCTSPRWMGRSVRTGAQGKSRESVGTTAVTILRGARISSLPYVSPVGHRLPVTVTTWPACTTVSLHAMGHAMQTNSLSPVPAGLCFVTGWPPPARRLFPHQERERSPAQARAGSSRKAARGRTVSSSPPDRPSALPGPRRSSPRAA